MLEQVPRNSSFRPVEALYLRRNISLMVHWYEVLSSLQQNLLKRARVVICVAVRQNDVGDDTGRHCIHLQKGITVGRRVDDDALAIDPDDEARRRARAVKTVGRSYHGYAKVGAVKLSHERDVCHLGRKNFCGCRDVPRFLIRHGGDQLFSS